MFILKPSGIHGVGVFTTKKIKAGTRIEWDLFRRGDLKRVKRVTHPLERRYCIWDRKLKIWWCPQHFSRMSLGWYTNHSKTPNVSCGGRYDHWVTLRDIKAGEEITISYKAL